MNIYGFEITLEMVIIVLACMIVILLSVLILVILSMNKIKKLNEKYDRFMMGANAKSLEKIILESLEAQEELNSFHDKMIADIQNIYSKLLFTVQKVSINKYDAFANTGGKLSYTIVLLDENNNGVVITSVHSLEGSYNYAKEIKEGKADVLLTQEEQKTLDKAYGNN
ncbi:MAG: DUF4446 family protein [Lachnospiraceae bacterium]